MKNFTVNSIGTIKNENGNASIVLDKKYISALKGIEDFGYINILWWFHKLDNTEDRNQLVEDSPYKGSPDTLGVFATRSLNRPNPIVPSWCKLWPNSLEESGEFDWSRVFNF